MSGIPFDGYAPYCRVTIRTRDGQVYPLWFDPTGRAASSDRADRPFVEEVSVKVGLDVTPVITAKLGMPYAEGMAFLDSKLVEWANDSYLEVQMGYTPPSGRVVLSPVFGGLLLKPGVDLGENISITLNAQGIPVIHAPAGAATVTRRGTRRAIIDELMRGPDAGNPARIELDTTEVEALGPAHEAYRAIFSDALEVQQSGRTNWQMLQQLAWEARCWPVVVGAYGTEPARLKIVPRAIIAARGPTRTFRFYNHPPSGYTTGREYPLFTVSSPSVQDYLSDRTVPALRQTGVDRQTRRPTVEVTTDATALPARIGPNAQTTTPSPTQPGLGAGGRQGAVSIAGDPKDPRAVAAARAMFDHGTTSAGVKINGRTVGIPDLTPGEIAFVTGVGRRLVSESGYLLMVATFTVGGEGYNTDLEMVSNTAEALENAVRASGATAQNAPPPPTAPTGGETQTPTPSPPARGRRR